MLRGWNESIELFVTRMRVLLEDFLGPLLVQVLIIVFAFTLDYKKRFVLFFVSRRCFEALSLLKRSS